MRERGLFVERIFSAHPLAGITVWINSQQKYARYFRRPDENSHASARRKKGKRGGCVCPAMRNACFAFGSRARQISAAAMNRRRWERTARVLFASRHRVRTNRVLPFTCSDWPEQLTPFGDACTMSDERVCAGQEDGTKRFISRKRRWEYMAKYRSHNLPRTQRHSRSVREINIWNWESDHLLSCRDFIRRRNLRFKTTFSSFLTRNAFIRTNQGAMTITTATVLLTRIIRQMKY